MSKASAVAAIVIMLQWYWCKVNLTFYNYVDLVRERTTPTEQPPLVDDVSADFNG
jgi:hypothetical protein